MAIAPVRFVIIGGGPAGHQAATTAARLGAEVTLVERDVIGGAAHLWDCVPSKAMIATGDALSISRRAPGMGLVELRPELDVDSLKRRINEIEDHLNRSVRELLDSQGVRIVKGSGRLVGPNKVVVDGAGAIASEELTADAILLCTGSRPRVPEWFEPDGDRLLTTRQAYPPQTMPETGRDRVRCHRGRVRPHVQVVRIGRVTHRQPPAGVTGQRLRGRRCVGGGLPCQRRQASQGGACGKRRAARGRCVGQLR